MEKYSVIVVSISAAYLLACLVIGMLPGRKASSSAAGYVAGDRSLGVLVMYFITGATIFSAFAFLGAPGWAYSRGAAAFYILAYGTLGFLPFYFLGPRAARLGKAYGFVTQAQMVSERFRFPALAGVMALISTVAFVPYLALQMKGAGYVLEEMTHGAVPSWVGAAIVYGVVMIYVLRSGVLGVGWTNTFQGIFMMALAWIMGLYLPHVLYGGVGPMFDEIIAQRPELLTPPGLTGGGESWSWGEYSTAVLVSVIGFAVWPHLFMKAFTARDEQTIRRTVVLYPTFQLFIIPLLLIGFAGVMFPSSPDAPDQILPHMLMNLELSPVVVGFFCAGALAASMSSGDAIVHAGASILVRDGWVTSLRKPLEARAERLAIRVLVVVLLIGSYVLAVLFPGTLVDLLLFAYGPVVQFAPAVYATLFLRRVTGVGLLVGLVVGVAVNVLFALYPDLRPWPINAGILGLAVNVLAVIVISAVTRAKTDEETERYLAIAGGRDSGDGVS